MDKPKPPDTVWDVRAPIHPWTPYGPIGGDDAHGAGRLIRAPQAVTITARPDDNDHEIQSVVIEAALIDGRYRMERFEVSGHGRGVSAEAIRRVPISGIFREGVANTMRVEGWDTETDEQWTWYDPMRDEGVAVDVIYMLARAVGDNPTTAVADHFGITHAAAAGRIRRRRKEHNLPPTTKGKVS